MSSTQTSATFQAVVVNPAAGGPYTVAIHARDYEAAKLEAARIYGPMLQYVKHPN
jgi:hypothetical protein